MDQTQDKQKKEQAAVCIKEYAIITKLLGPVSLALLAIFWGTKKNIADL